MLSVRVCEKPHRKTTTHVYGQQGRVFIFPCMQGVNHSANEQMMIPKEAHRLLKSVKAKLGEFQGGKVSLGTG